MREEAAGLKPVQKLVYKLVLAGIGGFLLSEASKYELAVAPSESAASRSLLVQVLQNIAKGNAKAKWLPRRFQAFPS